MAEPGLWEHSSWALPINCYSVLCVEREWGRGRSAGLGKQLHSEWMGNVMWSLCHEEGCLKGCLARGDASKCFPLNQWGNVFLQCCLFNSFRHFPYPVFNPNKSYVTWMPFWWAMVSHDHVSFPPRWHCSHCWKGRRGRKSGTGCFVSFAPQPGPETHTGVCPFRIPASWLVCLRRVSFRKWNVVSSVTLPHLVLEVFADVHNGRNSSDS